MPDEDVTGYVAVPIRAPVSTSLNFVSKNAHISAAVRDDRSPRRLAVRRSRSASESWASFVAELLRSADRFHHQSGVLRPDLPWKMSAPAENHLGWLVLFIPIVGGVICGLMARYGSKAIRGHGIPEAMEQILTNRSRIPARITFLKPVSAAIAIGTGGPFGAEGPIIATGRSSGFDVRSVALRTYRRERKTFLAAGAAAGMSAIFGSPVAAVLLAIELLLFEFRPRSIIPVALGQRHRRRNAISSLVPARSGIPDARRRCTQHRSDGILHCARRGDGAGGGGGHSRSSTSPKMRSNACRSIGCGGRHWADCRRRGRIFFVPARSAWAIPNIDNILSGQTYPLSRSRFCAWRSSSPGPFRSAAELHGGTMAPLFTIGGASGRLSRSRRPPLFPLPASI